MDLSNLFWMINPSQIWNTHIRCDLNVKNQANFESLKAVDRGSENTTSTFFEIMIRMSNE